MLLVRKYAVLLFLVLFVVVRAAAQEKDVLTPKQPSATSLEEQTSFKYYTTSLQNVYIYYENDKAWPRWSYRKNVEARKALMKIVKELSTDKHTSRAIIIEGAASPIGSDRYNRALSLRRAAVLRRLISKFDGADKLKIYTLSVGEDWTTFAQHIDRSYHLSNREKVLAIVNAEGSNDEKERKLYALDNGVTWWLLVENHMAPARNAAVVRIIENEPIMTHLRIPDMRGRVKPAELILPFDVSRVADDTTAVVVAAQTKQPTVELRKPVVAIRTNLLVPALNVGVVVPIGNRWSVAADYYYPWVWPKRDNKNCFEFLGWGIEGRYWFGSNRNEYTRLQGHSIGLYGYMGYYDFEYNFHGHQGEFANVGIDYTFAMAVGKKRGLHLEFSLGVGYIYSQARKYTVIESGSPLISDKITKTVGFFGPTKANISLVVPIFQKVKPNNKRRGDE